MNEPRTEFCRNCGHVHDIRDSEHSYREIMNEPQASPTPETDAMYDRMKELLGNKFILNKAEEFELELWNHARRLERQRDVLVRALESVFALIDENWLIRDTSRDHIAGWALRQIEPVQRLAAARAALAEVGKGR